MNMLFSYRDWWHRVSVQKPIKCSKTDFFDETVDPRLWSIFDEVNQQTDQRPIFEEVLVWKTFWDLNVGLLHFAAITFSPLQQNEHKEKNQRAKLFFHSHLFKKKLVHWHGGFVIATVRGAKGLNFGIGSFFFIETAIAELKKELSVATI